MDPNNPVIRLCAAGMECDGVPEEALPLFEQAWRERQDDYDAAVAAHYIARHQSTPSDTLHWNTLAATHAERVTDGRATELFPSLYLNLAASLVSLGRFDDARVTIARAAEHVAALPADGYREFLVRGIDRLRAELGGGT